MCSVFWELVTHTIAEGVLTSYWHSPSEPRLHVRITRGNVKKKKQPPKNLMPHLQKFWVNWSGEESRHWHERKNAPGDSNLCPKLKANTSFSQIAGYVPRLMCSEEGLEWWNINWKQHFSSQWPLRNRLSCRNWGEIWKIKQTPKHILPSEEFMRGNTTNRTEQATKENELKRC